ncbi:Ohr family peroxiredoxin [Rhizobium leguminosarum]|uniref:Ohr family peroxiredoxin n=2 Tax=Rhizobium leguminosarum TaxID=384 RepID=A0A444I7H3_RHILE|nr:Ohr family peroxiredoxin [Rhizobium leguminosarum]
MADRILSQSPPAKSVAGWSACFIGALSVAASKRKISLPPSTAVDAEVDLGVTDGSYSLQARLTVSLPEVEPELARVLVEEAHATCPYSKATRGNINVAQVV